MQEGMVSMSPFKVCPHMSCHLCHRCRVVSLILACHVSHVSLPSILPVVKARWVGDLCTHEVDLLVTSWWSRREDDDMGASSCVS